MKTSQKIALTFSISLLLTGVFALFAYTGFFRFLEGGFFSERVKTDQLFKLQKISVITDEWNQSNIDRFGILSRDTVFQAVYSIIQRENEVNSRQEIIDSLSGRLDGFRGIRIVDNEGQIQYSSFAGDIKSEQKNSRRVYRDWDEIPDFFELPVSEEQSSSRVYYDEDNQTINYLIPSQDKAFLYRGWMIVTMNSVGLGEYLAAEMTIASGGQIQIVDKRGVIADIRQEDFEAIRSQINRYWGSDDKPREFALLTGGAGGRYWLAGTVSAKGTWIGKIVPDRLLLFSPLIQALILLAVFLTLAFLLFFFLNIRQDQNEILRNRISKLHASLLSDWIEQHGGQSVPLEDLESRREEVKRELLAGLGKIKKDQKVFAQELIDDGWTQIINILAGRTVVASEERDETEKKEETSSAEAVDKTQPVIDYGEIEAMITRAIANANIVIQPHSPWMMSPVNAQTSSVEEDLVEMEGEPIGDLEEFIEELPSEETELSAVESDETEAGLLPEELDNLLLSLDNEETEEESAPEEDAVSEQEEATEKIDFDALEFPTESEIEEALLEGEAVSEQEEETEAIDFDALEFPTESEIEGALPEEEVVSEQEEETEAIDFDTLELPAEPDAEETSSEKEPVFAEIESTDTLDLPTESEIEDILSEKEDLSGEETVFEPETTTEEIDVDALELPSESEIEDILSEEEVFSGEETVFEPVPTTEEMDADVLGLPTEPEIEETVFEPVPTTEEMDTDALGLPTEPVFPGIEDIEAVEVPDEEPVFPGIEDIDAIELPPEPEVEEAFSEEAEAEAAAPEEDPFPEAIEAVDLSEDSQPEAAAEEIDMDDLELPAEPEVEEAFSEEAEAEAAAPEEDPFPEAIDAVGLSGVFQPEAEEEIDMDALELPVEPEVEEAFSEEAEAEAAAPEEDPFPEAMDAVGLSEDSQPEVAAEEIDMDDLELPAEPDVEEAFSEEAEAEAAAPEEDPFPEAIDAVGLSGVFQPEAAAAEEEIDMDALDLPAEPEVGEGLSEETAFAEIESTDALDFPTKHERKEPLSEEEELLAQDLEEFLLSGEGEKELIISEEPEDEKLESDASPSETPESSSDSEIPESTTEAEEKLLAGIDLIHDKPDEDTGFAINEDDIAELETSGEPSTVEAVPGEEDVNLQDVEPLESVDELENESAAVETEGLEELEELEELEDVVVPIENRINNDEISDGIEELSVAVSGGTYELTDIDRGSSGGMYMYKDGIPDKTSPGGKERSFDDTQSSELEELEELNDLEPLDEVEDIEPLEEAPSDTLIPIDTIKQLSESLNEKRRNEIEEVKEDEIKESDSFLFKTPDLDILPILDISGKEFNFDDTVPPGLWTDKGFDYDKFLVPFKEGSSGIYKSLIKFTRDYNALCGVILSCGEKGGLNPEYAVGLDEESITRLSVTREEPLWKTWFSERVIAVIPNLATSYYSHKIKSTEYRFIKSGLFIPVQFRGKDAYLFCGFKEIPEDLETKLASISI